MNKIQQSQDDLKKHLAEQLYFYGRLLIHMMQVMKPKQSV